MSTLFEAALPLIQQSKTVLITTHIRPDGDALGSSGALCAGLRYLGKQADVLLLSRLPNKYAFIHQWAGVTPLINDNGAAPWPLENVDLLIIVDTGTFSQLPGLETALKTFTGKVLVIDHHLTQEPWGHVRVVNAQAGAAAQLVAELLNLLKVPVSGPVAGSLYTGLATDTGWFAFSNTTPELLRLAADLLQAGAPTDEIYQRVYQSETAKRLLLQARAFPSMSLDQDDSIAVITVSGEDFRKTGADVTDTEGMVNWPLQIGKVKVSLLATEATLPNDAHRMSLRSKGQIDCSKVAMRFGGGGHARAAGLKMNGDFKSAVEQVKAALIDEMRSAAK